MALQELSNVDIDSYYKNNPRYGGCFSKDDIIHANPKSNKFYVLNLDSRDGQGSHWVCLYNCDKKYVYYFDSFGVAPAEQVVSFCRKTGTVLAPKIPLRNIADIQTLNSSACGYYCIYCLDHLLKGESFLDVVNRFDSVNQRNNERLMKRYFRKS